MISVKGAILDVLLHSLLIAATVVAILRLERRGWARAQFSIADMLSLTAATGMVLGLVCTDQIPLASEMYLPLNTLYLFDCVVILFTIACAVWLIVSTAMERLGRKSRRDMRQ
jgi:hypothetical protein